MLFHPRILCLAALLALLSPCARCVWAGEEKPSPGQTPGRVDRLGDPLPAGALARFGSCRGRDGLADHVRAVYNPARHLLATAGLDSHLHLFDLKTGRRLRTIDHDDAAAGPIAFSPDGSIVAVESRADVCLYDTDSGRLLRQLKGHATRLDALAFSPDGRRLASVEGQDIRVWDPATGKLLRALKPTDGFHRFAAFSPDSKMLAVICEDDQDKIRLWEVESGKERPALLPGTRQGALAFSPDGKVLACVGADLQLWDLAASKRLHSIDLLSRKALKRGLIKVAFSPDGQLVATAVGQTILVFEADSGKKVRTFQAKPFGLETTDYGKNIISCLGFSADGKKLVSWACEDRPRVCEVATGRDLLLSTGHEGELLSIVPAADGKRAISWAADRRLCLWELSTGKETALEWVPPGQRVVALSPDCRHRVTASGTGLTMLQDAATGKQRAELPAVFTPAWGTGQAFFSPDSKTLALFATRQATVYLWDIASNRHWPPFSRKERARPDGPPAFAFAPDSRTAAMVDDGRIVQWTVATGQTVRTFDPGEGRCCTTVAFAPDGTLLASLVAPRTIRIWKVATGKDVRTFAVKSEGDLNCLAFSADNASLAAGGEDNRVWLVEAASGDVRRAFEGHQGGVQAIAFAPDGKTLVSGSKDWTALVWDLTAPWDRVAPHGPVVPLVWDDAWRDLGSGDAARAYRAVCLLARRPDQAVPLLKGHLKEVLSRDGISVERLIKQLDSDSFEEREKASAALAEMGQEVEDTLHKTLADKPSPEVRLRIELLLEGLKEARPSPEQLRGGRVVEALEHLGTAEARALLKTLVQKAAGVRVQQQARAALLRLERTGKRP